MEIFPRCIIKLKKSETQNNVYKIFVFIKIWTLMPCVYVCGK